MKESQIIDLAYYLINKYPIYKDALMAWNCCLPATKKWIAFKLFMRKKYQELKKVGALKIKAISRTVRPNPTYGRHIKSHPHGLT